MMMKHKRIAALLLALTAAFCLTGAANAADESPVVWEGTLTEVLEDGFVMQEADGREILFNVDEQTCLLYTSPSPRDISGSRMPSSA